MSQRGTSSGPFPGRRWGSVLAPLLRACLLVLVACGRASEGGTAPAPSVASSAVLPAASAAPLAPLDAPWLVRIPLPDFGDVVVAVPTGATASRPVVVGVHGARDRPEWACGEWMGITQGYPFILCPHGVPADASREQLVGFATADDLRREIDAGLAALRARFGPYVAEGPAVYGGFSRGAYLGVSVIAATPARFPVAVLGEGGQDPWSLERARAFASGGGRRVLFACSTLECELRAAPAMELLERVGVETRHVSSGRIGHVVDDRVVSRIRQEWAWVVQDGIGGWGLTGSAGAHGSP